MRVENRRNARSYTSAGLNTMDRAYVLSAEEAEKYLPTDKDRGGLGWWWLRTPGKNGACVCYITNSASAQTDRYIRDDAANYPGGAVRPALWVDLYSLYAQTK